MDYKQRNKPYRGELKKTPYHLSLRLHRALSWLHRIESCESHFDGQLVLLLLAFDAPNLQEKWQEKSHKTKRQANMAIAKQHIAKIIEFALPRLYTLRKHIIHIGANCYSNANHSQLNDSVKLPGKRVPIIIEGMMGNPQAFWDKANYLLMKQGGM
jgi:hypothetical protein